MLVPQAATASGEDDLPLIVPGHVGNDFHGLGITDNRPCRHLDHEILAALAMAVALFARRPVFGGVLAPVAEVYQSIQALVNLED